MAQVRELIPPRGFYWSVSENDLVHLGCGQKFSLTPEAARDCAEIRTKHPSAVCWCAFCREYRPLPEFYWDADRRVMS